MRCLIAVLLVSPGAALAHPGHWAGLAGHDHWIALGALGVAGGIALWAGLKGKAKADEAKAEPEDEDQPEESPA